MSTRRFTPVAAGHARIETPVADEDGATVVLVHEDGRPAGTVGRRAAHRLPGLLHSAVSVVIINSLGQVLLQRRARNKDLFGGYWSNSCCTHPLLGETASEAAHRRAYEELGVELADVEEAGTFVYRAQDPRTSLIEFERDTVVTATSDDVPRVDPREVSAWEWTDADVLSHRRPLTPWTPYVHAVAAISSLTQNSRTACMQMPQ